MPSVRHFIACCTVAALALQATAAAAELRAGEWASYRDAYRAMLVFEKYAGAKHYLDSQLQVLPRAPGGLPEGVQLTLAGKLDQRHLPLDALGRTQLPLQKNAYDENAVLLLSPASGAFALQPRVSLALPAGGVYEEASLRAACEQALAFERYRNARFGADGCAGVRLVFASPASARQVRLRQADASEAPLAPHTAPAYPDQRGAAYPTVVYRFQAQLGARVVSGQIPLAILPLFD